MTLVKVNSKITKIGEKYEDFSIIFKSFSVLRHNYFISLMMSIIFILHVFIYTEIYKVDLCKVSTGLRSNLF